MATELVFIIWLVAMAFCGPIFIKSILKKDWISICLPGLLIALFLCIVTSFFYRNYMSSSPNWVYQQAFGERPNNIIKVSQARYTFGADFTEIYLVFETNEIKPILSKATFKPIQINTYKDRFHHSNMPSWFILDIGTATDYYQADPFDKSGFLSQALLSYNKESKTVYYYFSEIF